MRVLLFLSLLFIFGCKSKEIVIADASRGSSLEPGKCYYSLFKIGKENGYRFEKKPFILEVKPVEYEMKLVNSNEPKLKEYFSGDSIFYFPSDEVSIELRFRNENLFEVVSPDDLDGFLFCAIEIPSGWSKISEAELRKNKYLISQKVVKNSSKITKRYVNRKPKKLKKNQLYFESGYYSNLMEAVGHPGCYGGGPLNMLKAKLIELGYDIDRSLILDENTKAAIFDFQKKNGLKTGQLDFETLKKLGVDY